MIQFKRILSPVDFFSASTRASRYAGRIASHYGARLDLLHVVITMPVAAYEYPIDLTVITAQMKKEAQRHLQRLLATKELSGVDVRPQIETGDLRAALDKTVTGRKPDLLVMGTHGARGFQRWLIGSTTRRMLHHTSVPVLTVSAAAKSSVNPFRRILVATDFSKGTSRALDYAFSLAEMSGARILLLHVLEETRAITSAEYRRQRAQEAERELAKLLTKSGKPVKVDILVDAGTPYDVILNTVRKQKIDLVVMNTQGKGLLDRTILGSTSERVLGAAACPVLLIPPRPVDRVRRMRRP